MKKIILGLLILSSFIISNTYAAEVIFDSTKESMSAGEIVTLSGTIDGGIEGDLVAIEVKSPSGEIILIRTVELGQDGVYELKFKVPASAESGVYDITINVELVGTEAIELEAAEKVTPPPPPICGFGEVLENGVCVPEQLDLFPIEYVIVGIVIAVIASIVIILSRRKKAVTYKKGVAVKKFCNKCGTPVIPSNKFCKKCGNVIIKTI